MRMLSAIVSKRVIANATLASAVVVGAALISFVPAANALTYSTSGAPEQFALGDTLHTQYDKLIINPSSGTLVDGGTITLNSLTFIAGVNATVPQFYSNISSISETIKVGTSTQPLVIPFNLNISYSDTLTIIGGTTLSFLDGTSIWNIVVNGLTIGPNSGGPMYANLTAQVSDPVATPLPAALLLYATGLGAMGLFGWRRKRKASAPIAA
jgi:hypothetical protein